MSLISHDPAAVSKQFTDELLITRKALHEAVSKQGDEPYKAAIEAAKMLVENFENVADGTIAKVVKAVKYELDVPRSSSKNPQAEMIDALLKATNALKPSGPIIITPPGAKPANPLKLGD